MSIYSDISKRIGWKKTAVAFPSKEKSEALRDRVKNGDTAAFEEVFSIYRHAPYTGDNEAMAAISEAYKIGCQNKDWR